MYQPQQFHTSNYRGNQQGHDTYLRADSQSPSSYGAQNVTSQYRGFQKPFQPTGPVQSFYGQNAGFNQPSSSFSSSFGSQAGAQNYHTANYRGNQQGHDSYLHSDSRQPSQSQIGGFGASMNPSSFSPSASSFSAGAASGFSGVSSYNQNQNQSQYVSPESFHTSNYRGNQQDHDSYLHSDSRQPSQSQFGMGASGSFGGMNVSQSFTNMNPSFGTTSITGSAGLASGSMMSSGMGAASFGGNVPYSQNQFASSESYHTANYRGNQQGHDSNLHSDSRQPSQSQFGTSSMGNIGSSYGANRF